MRPTTRRTVLAGSGLLGLTALAACAPGGGTTADGGATSGDGSTGTATPAEVVTDISTLGEITLTVWDQEVRGGQNEQIEQLNAAFMEKYPNVTIDRVSQANDDLQQTLGLALSGSAEDVPDVVQANNARGSMGAFVGAGQLVDLTPWAAAYGWAERYPESVLSMTRYSADGVTFGSGNLYGLAQVGEICGVFASASKLAEIGIDEMPSTWEELTDAMQTAVDAGVQPVALGNIEKWPALHVFGPLQGRFVAPVEIANLAMGNEGSSWLSDPNVQAATEFQAWAEAGFLGPDANGTDYDAAWRSFTEGGSALLIGGSWLAADMEAVMGDDLHFFAPTIGEGEVPSSTGGTSIPFAIPSASDQADAAAAYIDFLTTSDAMAVLAETGNMPVLNTAEHAPASGVQKEIFETFSRVSAEGVLLPYLDYATPSFAETIGTGLQNLIGGQADVESVLQSLEDDYAGFVEQA